MCNNELKRNALFNPKGDTDLRLRRICLLYTSDAADEL